MPWRRPTWYFFLDKKPVAVLRGHGLFIETDSDKGTMRIGPMGFIGKISMADLQ
jgi:hypothetical protein